MSFPVRITIVDVSVYCGSQSSINLAEFIWKHLCVFAINMYAKVCVSLNTTTVFYLHHHRAASDGWTSDCLCDGYLEEFRLILQPFVGNCTYGRSCGCNVCLRQPPSLRGLASHTVFRLTFNLSEFALTIGTLYHQYFYAVEWNIFPDHRLVPLTFSRLQCTFCGTNDVRSVKDITMTA